MGRDLSDRSHLLCLQSSSVLVPQWKDVPRDCFLLQDLNFLPSLSLRLTLTGFLTTSEVLVFLLLPGFLSSSIFLPPPHPPLDPESFQGNGRDVYASAAAGPLVPSRWRNSALVQVFLPPRTHTDL